MRLIHMPHFHKSNRHLFRRHWSQIIHDPLFWTILILALVVFAMMFLMALQPVLQNPKTPIPMYPYMTW